MHLFNVSLLDCTCHENRDRDNCSDCCALSARHPCLTQKRDSRNNVWDEWMQMWAIHTARKYQHRDSTQVAQYPGPHSPDTYLIFRRTVVVALYVGSWTLALFDMWVFRMRRVDLCVDGWPEEWGKNRMPGSSGKGARRWSMRGGLGRAKPT